MRKWQLPLLFFGFLVVALAIAGFFEVVLTPRRLSHEAGKKFQIAFLVAEFGFSLAALIGVFCVFVTRKRSVQALAVGLALVGMIGFIGLRVGNWGVRSVVSARNECLTNLRKIDRAKEMLRLSKELTERSSVSAAMLEPYLTNGIPACPAVLTSPGTSGSKSIAL